ncbi:MAG: tetratricopeptide repeat protein, partial [Planctomycetes bacterium]|nr:tetratricopeptide repeat protein [Planctomycetota bacterium]
GERNREYWDSVHACGACYRDAGLPRKAQEKFDRNVEAGLVPFPEGADEDLTIQQIVQLSRLESARVRVRLGGKGEMDEAAAIYRAMLRSPTLGPRTREWRAALAELGLLLLHGAAQGQTEPLWEGLGYLDEYVQRYGAEDGVARLGEIQEARARGLMRAGRWADAAGIWSGLRAERPAIPAPAWALALEADCLLATGRPGEAALLYERSLARDGADPDGHLHASWFEARRLAGMALPPPHPGGGFGSDWERIRREVLLGPPGGQGP